MSLEWQEKRGSAIFVLQYFIDFLYYINYNGCNGGGDMAKIGRPKAEVSKDHTISIRLRDEDYKRIKEFTDRCDTTITKLVEAAVKEYIASHKAD